jgi:hypothetical protein
MFLFPGPNCPYLLSWVKINGFINKWFYFILFYLKSFPAPAFWSFLFPPCDSIRAFLHTFQHALWWKGEKTENFTCFFLWTAIWEVAILLTYLWAYVFMLELFGFVVSFSCCVICSFMWKQLGLSYTWSLLVLAWSISEEGLWIYGGSVHVLFWSDQDPVLFHQTHARLLTLASRLLLQ